MSTADRAVTDHLREAPAGEVLRGLAEFAGPGRLLEVVDVGASPLVGEPAVYLPLVDAGLARLTAFEPDPEALAALATLRQDSAGLHRHLGHAVGDGGEHSLRQCAAAGFSSLLEPDPTQLAVLTDFTELAAVTGRSAVTTVRLDDLAEVERADLVALDVQGAEPAVLDGAQRVLATSFAVQVEMAFHRLYVEGPTFVDVDTRLRAAGLVPHCFVTTRTWPLAPVTWDDPLEPSARHLVEADLLYIRDPARLADVPEDVLRAGVLLAAVYGQLGASLVAVRELARRKLLPRDAEQTFRALVTPAGRP